MKKILTSFMAYHNGKEPLVGTKIKWAWEVWKKWAYTPPVNQTEGKDEPTPHG